MNRRIFGLACALAVFVADQASKYYMLEGLDLETAGTITINPFVDFVLVWNRGISYGLFQQYQDLGRYGLAGLSVLAAIALTIWLLRTRDLGQTLALGCLIGGALGNALDRFWHGAVVDFVLLHIGEWRWYVFNLADIAIVAGVALLLYDSWLGNKNPVVSVPEKDGVA